MSLFWFARRPRRPKLPDTGTLVEMAQMRGMIWWLASDLAADDGDPNTTPETWVALAEKHWRNGLRYETRFLNLT